MKAVICVGGEGSRMGYKLKPLVMKNNKTLLENIIERLNVVEEVILITNGKTEFDKLGYRIFNTFKELKQEINEDIILMVGDSIIDFDIEELINFHNSNKDIPTILVDNYQIPYGVIQDGIWIEKPTYKIAVGVFVLHTKILPDNFYIPDAFNSEFKIFPGTKNLLHLTTMEDFDKWKNS